MNFIKYFLLIAFAISYIPTSDAGKSWNPLSKTNRSPDRRTQAAAQPSNPWNKQPAQSSGFAAPTSSALPWNSQPGTSGSSVWGRNQSPAPSLAPETKSRSPSPIARLFSKQSSKPQEFPALPGPSASSSKPQVVSRPTSPIARLPEKQSSKPQEFPALPGPSASSSKPEAKSRSTSPIARLFGKQSSKPQEFPDLPGPSHSPALSKSQLTPKKSLNSPEVNQKSHQQFPALAGPKLPLGSHGSSGSLASSSESLSRLHLASGRNEVIPKQPLNPLKSQKSHEEFPALPGSRGPAPASSSESLSPGNFPALSKPRQVPQNLGVTPTTSLAHFPALGGLRLKNPGSRSPSLNSPSTPSSPGFVRGGSVDSRFSNSPLNSPLNRNKNFFGSSSSGLSSGLSTSSSKTSLNSMSSGYQSGPASAKTCKDDNSPAHSCFDYFTFAMFWPPSMGYKYKTQNKKVNPNISKAQWSIHGLWPSSYAGQTTEKCHQRTTVSFSRHRFAQERFLQNNLERMWFNICPYTANGCSMASFWENEFKRHGACATRSPYIRSDVGYFKKSVELYGEVNLFKSLFNVGLRLGESMAYGELVTGITQTLGVRPRVEFIKHQNKEEYYLLEIRVCYNLDFQRMNCPGTGLISQDVRNYKIQLPGLVHEGA